MFHQVYVTKLHYVTYTFTEVQKLDLLNLSAEELMLIYQSDSPDKAYAAFSVLYDRYGQRVFNFLNARTRNSADSEDLLQKVFIKIHESKHKYKPKFKFEQWLFVIARSQMLDHFRAKSRYEKRLEGIYPSELTAKDSDQVVLKDLDSDQMELLEMKFIDELSYQEISRLVNKSEVSLRKSVSRLVGRLKNGVA